MYEYDNHNRPQDPWGDPIETTGRPLYEEPGAPEPRRKKKGAGKLVALCLVCAIVGGIAGAGGVAAATGTFSANRTTLLEGSRPATVVSVSNVTGKELLTAPEIYAAYVGSTVGITTEIVTTNGWGQPVSQAAAGSGFVITQDVSGSAARGFTYTLDVSGNIYAAYVDTEGKANDPSDLVNMSIAGARYAADADNKGGVIVTTTLGIDKTVKVSNSGVLDVSGQLSMPESTISNSGVVSIVGEDGFIQVNTAINNDVNGVMYQTREGAAPGTPYVNYASFANAVAGVTAETNLNNSKTVTVLGEVTVSANVAVPSPVSVVVTGELIIGTSDDRDVSVTIAAGAKSSGSGKITVNGSLTYDNKRNDGVADTVADVVMEDEARDGYRTYTNIYTALANATDGSTVTVSKVGGYVDVSENITVPEGVTLVVPNGSAPLVLADGVTMTVDGTLETAVDIYAETMFAVSASDIDSSNVNGENASAIVVNGTIDAADDKSLGFNVMILNGTIDGAVDIATYNGNSNCWKDVYK